MAFNLANLNLGGILGGVGELAKDLRTAITGKEPIDASKAAEIAMKVQELETHIELARMQVMTAEASSSDKWTSRARPSFMYVMYTLLLASIPMGVMYAVNPTVAGNIATGFGAWLKAIPEELYWLFGAGYLGYSGFRSFDKIKAGK